MKLAPLMKRTYIWRGRNRLVDKELCKQFYLHRWSARGWAWRHCSPSSV